MGLWIVHNRYRRIVSKQPGFCYFVMFLHKKARKAYAALACIECESSENHTVTVVPASNLLMVVSTGDRYNDELAAAFGLANS